jgi:hypothetical protein
MQQFKQRFRSLEEVTGDEEMPRCCLTDQREYTEFRRSPTKHCLVLANKQFEISPQFSQGLKC